MPIATHFIVLRKDCGQCGAPAEFVWVEPDIHQFQCKACAIAEFGRVWVEAALRMEQKINEDEERTGQKWRP